MIGHNTSGTVLHQLNAAVAGLGLALQDARTATREHQEQMVLVARHLLAVDEAAANDEQLADLEIKKAGVVLSTDLIASERERSLARWLARGGLSYDNRKNPNEINNLSAGELNVIEARFLSNKKLNKSMTYNAVHNVFRTECKIEIRAAFDSEEREANLDAIREKYADIWFKPATVNSWIAEEAYRRSPEGIREAELKKAWALRIKEALEEARQKNTAEALEGLERQVKKQLAQIREAAAEKRAEIEAAAKAKEAAVKLTSKEKRTLAQAARNAQPADDESEATDADFE